MGAQSITSPPPLNRGVVPRSLLFANLASCAIAGSVSAADAPTRPAPQSREELTIEVQNTPWKGDLDGMIDRGAIRVLVVPNKTSYFVVKGVQRGATYELVRAFEDDLNKRLARQKQLKNKNVKVKVIIVPVGRAEIADALLAGRGDIAAAGIVTTDFGRRLADFSLPIYTGMDEVVVSAPGLPYLRRQHLQVLH